MYLPTSSLQPSDLVSDIHWHGRRRGRLAWQFACGHLRRRWGNFIRASDVDGPDIIIFSPFRRRSWHSGSLRVFCEQVLVERGIRVQLSAGWGIPSCRSLPWLDVVYIIRSSPVVNQHLNVRSCGTKLRYDHLRRLRFWLRCSVDRSSLVKVGLEAASCFRKTSQLFESGPEGIFIFSLWKSRIYNGYNHIDPYLCSAMKFTSGY
jgi:hypothetical protein